MRACVIVAPGQVAIVDRPMPEPAPGEVVLRTITSAICASDFHTLYDRDDALDLRRSPSDLLGHESVGVVVDSRSEHFRAGELALAVPTLEYGRAFSEYQSVPDRYLVPLPYGHDPAKLLMAQQLGTIIFAMKSFLPRNVGRTPPLRSVAVFGLGPAGLNFVQFLAHLGVPYIIGIDVHGWRREAAAEMGAHRTIDPSTGDTVASIARLTEGNGVELAIEAAGLNATRHQAMLSVANNGRVGMFGIPEDREPDVVMPFGEIFRRTPTICMAVNAQNEPGLHSFRRARDLIAAGSMHPQALISHRFDLEQLGDALHAAHTPLPGVRKVVVDIGTKQSTDP